MLYSIPRRSGRKLRGEDFGAGISDGRGFRHRAGAEPDGARRHADETGAGSETVEVTGSAPILQTDRTEIGTIIDSTTNEALPLATRNSVQLSCWRRAR